MFLIDTNVAIALRDGVFEVEEAFAALDRPIALSIVSQVELEGGLATETIDVEMRLARHRSLLAGFTVLDFTPPAAEAYGAIVRVAGFSRRKVLDRMIAAHAMVMDATLVTLNGADFRDIPDLKLLEW